MPALLLSVFRFVRLLLSSHQAIAIENAALRLQLAAFQRTRKRPVLTTFDRVFWITLRRWWSGWRRPLFYVQADTVARWQRERYRRFWRRSASGLTIAVIGNYANGQRLPLYVLYENAGIFLCRAGFTGFRRRAKGHGIESGGRG